MVCRYSAMFTTYLANLLIIELPGEIAIYIWQYILHLIKNISLTNTIQDLISFHLNNQFKTTWIKQYSYIKYFYPTLCSKGRVIICFLCKKPVPSNLNKIPNSPWYLLFWSYFSSQWDEGELKQDREIFTYDTEGQRHILSFVVLVSEGLLNIIDYKLKLNKTCPIVCGFISETPLTRAIKMYDYKNNPL